jgi:hypothetical protein
MANIFNTEASVFFVGGRGTKADCDAKAGGCTKDWWDANVAAVGEASALAKIVGANGAPIVATTATSITNIDDGVTPALVYPSSMTGIEVGMVVFLEDLDTEAPLYPRIATGRYKILSVESTYFTVPNLGSSEISGASGFRCNIGGAVTSITDLIVGDGLDEVDATRYDVDIYTNKNETLASGVEFSAGGSVSNNSTLRVIGYNTTPGDMDYGGAYYQSAVDALQNGVTAGKSISWDFDNQAINGVAISVSKIVFKNIYFHNVSQASAWSLIAFASNPYGVGFINCKFDDGYRLCGTTAYFLRMDDCYIGDSFASNYPVDATWNSATIVDTVIKLKAASNGVRISYGEFRRCLIAGGYYGYAALTTPAVFTNCIFYAQTVACVLLASANYAMLMGENNVFMPAEAGDYVAYAASAAGSVDCSMLKNSVVWTAAGVAMTNHLSLNSVTGQLTDVVNVDAAGNYLDPLFADAANGDFRLLPGSPCLNMGRRTVGDGYSSIGAWQQKQGVRINAN